MIKKSYIAIILSGAMVLLAGCGARQAEAAAEIELLEPENAITATEPAAYRNLYNAEIFHTNVFPYMEEYAFESGGEVDKFRVLPGQTVRAGEVLVCLVTDGLDEDIEELEEKIADMDEEYLDYRQDMEEELAEIRGDAGRLEEIVEGIEEDEPEKYIEENGVKTENVNYAVEYAEWESHYEKYKGKYEIQSHNVTLKETALRQKRELYELDRSYQLKSLSLLKEEREKSILKAGMDGEVVAIGQTEYGSFKAKADEPVIAVADGSRKFVKCTYMKKSVITKAEEIYAVINGKKYELEYQPLESEEYLRLTENGEAVYTVFELLGDIKEVETGDYAVIVMMKERCENAVTIPKAAIYSDSLTHYVYVVENGQSVRRDVKLGMNDGVYTEIIAGLEIGEQVMVQETLSHGSREGLVEQGAYHDTFFKAGMMYYPSITEVTNPVEYGMAYYVERNVSLYQHVEKGDVIATIRVSSDEIELRRSELKLQRQKERLQDILDENDPEGNADDISDRQEEIEELEEKIAIMRRDAQTVHITAPVSGIVVQVETYTVEEALKKECRIAQIADENTCYLVVENTNQLLQYGDEVTITYKNQQKEECTIPGIVANTASMGVSRALQTEKVFILLPTEYVAELTAVEKNSKYTVTAEVKRMDNVPVVPKNAVTNVAGCTYVHIVDENGEIRAQSFLAGGQSAAGYWVLEGLTEGMKICLE